jgi:hypothetical protein
LRLLYLPSLDDLLLLLLLMAICIRHRVYRDVSMRVKRNTDAVRCGSTILPWTLVAGVDTATACRPGGSGRDASGSRAVVTEGWTTGTTIGTYASVSFSAISATRAVQMTAMAMGRRSYQLRRVEARAATVGPATALAWEALVVRINDGIHNRRGCL